MRAIRQITPGARLVQTEDLGRVFSTRALSYQAEFENERRWLSLDLLCGRVGRNHPWYDRFIVAGADERDLDLLLEGDCRPDVIGINHYVTSDRYLDGRLHTYPQHSWGGNKHQRYADVEAVRVDIGSADLGMKARLSEAWRRYHLPVAATEVHLGCTREHQVRWLVEAWNAAHQLRASGQDIRAVTAWALFGSSDWSSLLVSRRKHYESGAFDVRGPKPRRTALAGAVHALATEGKFAHPVLHGRGWWHRNDRYYAQRSVRREELHKDGMQIVVVPTGDLAFAELLRDICASRGLACSVLQLGEGGIEDQISAHRAWAVLNVDARLLRRFHEDGSRNSCYPAVEQVTELAEACARLSIPLVHLSSDLVFDGSLGRAYVEHDSVSSRRAGRASVAAETAVLTHCHDALVVRIGPLFGVAGEEAADFAGRNGGDITISPTFAPDLGNAVLDLLIDGERGIWHVANRGEIACSDFAKVVSGLQHVVAPIPAATLGRKSRNFALTSARGEVMPTLQDSVARFIRSRAELRPQEPLQVAAE
jgi:dTDP-4-dehydrorhamnose reductase